MTWFYELLWKFPLLRTDIGVLSDFLIISKLITLPRATETNKKISSIYADLVLDKFHSCYSSFCDQKIKNSWWRKIWVCLSIRLNQLGKIKINGESNMLEGMFSVITEVTCEMQEVPGKSLWISEQLDKIYLTFSLQSKPR